MSGYEVRGNTITDCWAGIKLGGGRSTTIVQNEFLHTHNAIEFDSRGETWQNNLCNPANADHDSFFAELKRDGVDKPPWSTRFPYLQHIHLPQQRPCVPMHNNISSNTFCAVDSWILGPSAKDIVSWGSVAKNNVNSSACLKSDDVVPPCTKDCCLDGTGNQTRMSCQPGFEFCGMPVLTQGPQFHLRDRTGCGENDPNGIVFDPVHGVVHHFFQKHLAAFPGGGPVYGHFASKDLVKWTALPVAIWNGFDYSVSPPRVTSFDNQAIYTGSAFVVDGAGPGGTGPGVVNLFPGLCKKQFYPECVENPGAPGSTGVVLAQAVPADYGDVLLTNWTKPDYNPVVTDGTRDPASPWRTESGSWLTRTYDSTIFGAASDADVIAGKWTKIGKSNLQLCECPSLYPLPAATPGFEMEYAAALKAGMPTHVHKYSCGPQSQEDEPEHYGAYLDWWQMGNYNDSDPLFFNATPGWEDVFAQKPVVQTPVQYVASFHECLDRFERPH